MGNELYTSSIATQSLTHFLGEPSRIKHLRVLDESMAATIYAGDIITVDTGNKKPVNDRCFLISVCGSVRVGRLLYATDNLLRVSSDNPDKTLYPDELVNDEPSFTILGRVIERRGDGGL
ncbi:S24 family peptidase [Luteibacter sp. E-22]|uniref:S24 family peptidase n=1 Tax=Luteibacter sp. E-22 TaxID=3404050 RepID=UPI003CEEF20B